MNQLLYYWTLRTVERTVTLQEPPPFLHCTCSTLPRPGNLLIEVEEAHVITLLHLPLQVAQARQVKAYDVTLPGELLPCVVAERLNQRAVPSHP
jgi:hypothetical protein